MPLSPGEHLGPYEIVDRLGAGAMGEVYRARDARLDREVAIKILPSDVSSDPDRLRRFEQEARAAGRLEHPNILAVHDFGQHDGTMYVVTELLEGMTLRDRLAEGAIPPRKAVEWARDLARGLGAAHEKGIVHRDVKPENLFVTVDGRIKVLDFGLARTIVPLLAGGSDSSAADSPTIELGTSPGTILGTVGYMAPEQVRGEPADARADVFAFGAVVFEMLTGQRAFARATSIDTLHAILREDPPELASRVRGVPAALERIVRRCLEKNPAERFQSMRDLGFAFEAVAGGGEVPSEFLAVPSTISGASLLPPGTKTSARRSLFIVAAIVAIAVPFGAILGGRFGFFAHPPAPTPSYRQLTFRRGTVYTARFVPDGTTIVYSAVWNGRPKELFSTSVSTREARPFGLVRYDIVGASEDGELAVLIRQDDGFTPATLARVPMAGGTPKEIAEGITWADWLGHGDEFVVIRPTEGKNRLELPIGNVLLETTHSLSYPRLSPDGKSVALLEHTPGGIGDAGNLVVVDRAGKRSVLSSGWASIEGVGWNPRGGEVWFTASKEGMANSLWAVRAGAAPRLLARAPGRLVLHDVGRDGRVLAEQNSFRASMTAFSPADHEEHDVSLFDFGSVAGLSADGTTLLFSESGNGAGGKSQSYLRSTAGGPTLRLGGGAPIALSRDGKMALLVPEPADGTILLIPAGAGGARTIRLGKNVLAGGFLPDGKRAVVLASEPEKAPRLWVVDTETGISKPLTPEGTSIRADPVSPDGRSAFAKIGPRVVIVSIDDQTTKDVPGATAADQPLAWTGDGRGLFVRERGQNPARIFRLDLTTGRRIPWRELAPSDPAGILGVWDVAIQNDGAAWAYSYGRLLSDLYAIDGGWGK